MDVCPHCKKEHTRTAIWWRRLAWWGYFHGFGCVMVFGLLLPFYAMGVLGVLLEHAGLALKSGAMWVCQFTRSLFGLRPWMLEMETTMERLTCRQRENLLREVQSQGETMNE